MTDTASETTTIEQAVHIAASPSTVWSFWTDPARLSQWWGSAAEVEAEPGGLFRVVMESGGPVMRGTFTELDPPHRLVFTFGWEHNPAGDPLAPGTTTVEVTLRPDGDGTELILRHRDMPAANAGEHQQGWAYFLSERLVTAASESGH